MANSLKRHPALSMLPRDWTMTWIQESGLYIVTDGRRLINHLATDSNYHEPRLMSELLYTVLAGEWALKMNSPPSTSLTMLTMVLLRGQVLVARHLEHLINNLVAGEKLPASSWNIILGFLHGLLETAERFAQHEHPGHAGKDPVHHRRL